MNYCNFIVLRLYEVSVQKVFCPNALLYQKVSSFYIIAAILVQKNETLKQIICPLIGHGSASQGAIETLHFYFKTFLLF